MKRLLIFSLLFNVCSSFARQESAIASELNAILGNIRKSPLVIMSVEKKTKSELLGTESSLPGVIYLTQDKFRWDSKGKEESRIIFDGATIWTIQEPPKGFKIPPQVTKMKMGKKNEGQLFLKSLFREKIESHFKIQKVTKNSKGSKYSLIPTDKNAAINGVDIETGPAGTLTAISYKDEVENRIEVLIKKVEKSNKIDGKLFQYSPPKGTQVNEI